LNGGNHNTVIKNELQIYLDSIEKTNIIDSDIRNLDKQIIILNSVNYTDDEDIFMNNYNAKSASHCDKKKYTLLAKKYLQVDDIYSNIYTKIEPLILTIENNNAHLYGWMQANREYNIPSYINTNSIMKRYLWGQYYHTFRKYELLSLHNNKLLYKTKCGEGEIIFGDVNGFHVKYMMVNIFFKL